MFVFLLSEILALEFGPLSVQTHGFMHSRQDAQILANLRNPLKDFGRQKWSC